MNRKKALFIIDNFKQLSRLKDYKQGLTFEVACWHFIDWFYQNGYMIISPKEVKEINGALIVWALHGGQIEELDEHSK